MQNVMLHEQLQILQWLDVENEFTDATFQMTRCKICNPRAVFAKFA
jgi:hypothetical protein